MIRHVLASIASAVLLLGGAIVMIFTIWTTSGDPIQAIVGEQTVPAALRASLELRYHIHDALPSRLHHYFFSLLHGDLDTYQSQIPVLALIAERAPRTMYSRAPGSVSPRSRASSWGSSRRRPARGGLAPFSH